MTLEFRIWLTLGTCFYLFLIIFLMRKNRMMLKYSLIWLGSAFIMFVSILFPQVLQWVCNILQIQSLVNGVFLLQGIFALLILVSLSSIVSVQSAHIRKLVQTQALLEKRVRDLEEKAAKPSDSEEE